MSVDAAVLLQTLLSTVALLKSRSTNIYRGFIPIPVAARSKACFCGHLPPEVVGSYPTGCMDVCCLLWVFYVVYIKYSINFSSIKYVMSSTEINRFRIQASIKNILIRPTRCTNFSNLFLDCCPRPLASWSCGFVSNGMYACLLSLVSFLCCQVEVAVSGWSLDQRNPTEGVVSECDCEASTMRRPIPTGGSCAIEEYRACLCSFLSLVMVCVFQI